ncbi:hypothetical protein I4U23_003546 [Adineta vaga]|nr:hypothetical protein I4U23_003546 [Adineta vaga]
MNNNKKRKATSVHRNPMTKKKFNNNYQISIEILSNEIFLNIFDYLEAFEIHHAFSNLNDRFHQLLHCPALRLKIKLTYGSAGEIFAKNHKSLLFSYQNQICSGYFHGTCDKKTQHSPKRLKLSGLVRIEDLIINHSCTFQECATIISHLPKIGSLFLTKLIENKPNERILPIKSSTLTRLILDEYDIPFNELEIFLQNIDAKLHVLSLDLESNDFNYLHDQRYENLILNYFPQLKKFYLKYRLFREYDEDYDFILYSIEPYEKQRYADYGQQLQLDLLPTDEFWEFFIMDNNHASDIAQIKHLIISEKNLFIGLLLDLMDLIPELLSLKLHSIALDRSKRSLNQNQVDLLCSSEDSIRIAKVYLEKMNVIEEIFFLLTLCPHMTYLKIDDINNINVEVFFRLILSKNQFEDNKSRRSICIHRIRGADDKMISELNKMINVEKLLINYNIQLLLYTKVSTDYDLYGIKIGINDHFMICCDNILLLWWIEFIPHTNHSSCTLSYNLTTCDFIYSITVPVTNNISFVYNCIDHQGNNVIGHISGNDMCGFILINEKIVSNYSTQDNFVIDIDGQGTGVYGFADDFIFFYELYPTYQLVVWSNNLDLSPRAIDIGTNQEYAVIVGYCQSTPTSANECGYLIQLNTSLSSPSITHQFHITDSLKYPWSDPRSIHYIPQSRLYTEQFVLSVSLAWHIQRVLIGIPALNTVLLYSLNNTQIPLCIRQNGIGFMGYGKSVTWLGSNGSKAAVLANIYTYSTYQWISSSVHLYDIESDDFSDSTQPIFVYPNSQQILQLLTDPCMIRITSSPTGHLGVFDRLGNALGMLSVPAGTYSDTNRTAYITSPVPCTRGTNRDYAGIELCYPYSSSSDNCSQNMFCPYGAVGEVSYSAFESIEQDHEYPESPENVVFDDILMQNMFMFDITSTHCLLVSPITWVLSVMTISFIVAIIVIISEAFCSHQHTIRDGIKGIFKKMDLIGEGELWIGGLTSAAIIVLIISAYSFSNSYLHQYPIEQVTRNSSFACDVTLRNAKFSTSTQKRWDSRHTTKESQSMFDLLNAQPFTLNIDLVQTAFTCDDFFYVQRLHGNKVISLSITKCEMNYNDTILSLAILLPVHEINVQLILPGLKTIGAIRVGLSGPSAEADNGRFQLVELKFASTFLSSSLNQVLAESIIFPIELTQVINQTDPLNTHESPTFSGIWSSSFSVNSDELFTNESRYTFFYRTQTNISIIIEQSIFYISNLQQPIARQTEIIFRSLLFTTVVLEVFALLFLILKLLIIPLFRTITNRICRKPQTHESIQPEKVVVIVMKDNKSTSFVKEKPFRRWSTIIEIKDTKY